MILGRINTIIYRLRTGIRAIWLQILNARIADCHEVIRKQNGPAQLNFLTLNSDLVPKKVTGFQDLHYLFASAHSNRGIIAQDFDEAAYLWSVVSTTRPKNILEIGRWLGGSTTLLASAASLNGGKIISIDLKVKAPEYARDELIKKHLEGLGLDNFELRVGSSFDFDPGVAIDLAFIDGDHSYEGVKKDFLNVMKHLSPGGHILFHDAGASRPFATCHIPVADFVRELKARDDIVFQKESGSIVHFAKV